MANHPKKGLIDSIQELHGDEVILRSFEDSLNLGITYAQIRSVDGSFEGFGEDPSAQMAWEKAYSEFIERREYLTLFKNGKAQDNLSGVACHVTPEQARIAAHTELLERDLVLCCWFAKIPPVWLSDAQISGMPIYSEFKKYQSTYLEHGIELRLGIAGQSNDVFVGFALLLGANATEPFGFAVFESSDTDLTSALLKALRGSGRIATTIVNRINARLPLYRTLAPAEVQSGDDHFHYYLNPKNIARADWFLAGSGNIPTISDTVVTTFDSPIKSNVLDPRYFAVAKSESIQKMFFGLPLANQINLKRITDVFGIVPNIDPNEVHPIA